MEKGYSVQGPVEVFHSVIPLEEGLSLEEKLVIGSKKQRQSECRKFKSSMVYTVGLWLPRAHTVRPVFIQKKQNKKKP